MDEQKIVRNMAVRLEYILDDYYEGHLTQPEAIEAIQALIAEDRAGLNPLDHVIDLDNPDDVDWLYRWSKLAEIEIIKHREREAGLVEALEGCRKAFTNWQIGQIPGRPEDILALIVKVDKALDTAIEGRK